ncbi:MAG TPA: glycosyltransferase 87 family protein [Acidisarcina sp.]
MNPEATASSPRLPARELLAYALLALTFAAISFAVHKTQLHGTVKPFWDARIYANAIAKSAAGADPYSIQGTELPFVYPPLFVRGGAILKHIFPARSGWYLYLAATCLAMAAIPWMLATSYTRSLWLTPLIAYIVFVFEPNSYAEGSLLTANIATLLYALTLGTAIRGLRRNQWTWFYLAVVFAALIKPPFLALLILPWLAGQRQLWKCALSVAVTVAAYLAQRFGSPALYASFQQRTVGQIMIKGDTGVGFLSFFVGIGHRLGLLQGKGALLACVLLAGVLAAALLLLRNQRNAPGAESLWVPALLVTAIVSNPRLMLYDADVAIIPAVFIYVEWLRTLPNARIRNTAAAVLLSFFAVLFSKDPPPTKPTAVSVLLLVSVLLVIARLARQTTRSVSHQPEPLHASHSR